MAQARLTTVAEIPGVGKVQLEGNIATEEAIRDLIAVFKSQEQQSKVNTDNINDNLDDAADNLDEFSDELSRADSKLHRVSETMKSLGDSTVNGIHGMQRFADSGGDLSSVVQSLGDTAVSFASGVAGSIPFISALAPGLGDLVGAAGSAVVGLTTMAVGTIEGFVGLNKSIFNAGLQIEGGFGAFGELAQDASMPINEFANAVIQSRDRLRLFSGGAPGGLQNVSRALAQLRDDGVMDNLYSLGFTSEEVVAGMSDYAIAAQRAGRNLSTEELAEGSNQYLRNLRELSRITGVSIQEQQARMDADRSNLFIQNALLDVNEAQRGEAQAFAAAIPEALGPIRDFIITGQSFTAESGLMASEMSTFAGIYRQAYEAVASGAMTQEQAQEYLTSALEANADQIEAEAERTTRAFGVAPSSIIAEGEALGAAIRAAREMVQAGVATDEAGGTDVETGSFQDALGTFEQTINEVQTSIQAVFFDGADALAPMVTRLANTIGETATTMSDYRELLGDALQGDTEALQRRFEEMFGTELTLDPGATAMEALTDAISDAIYDGFTRVLGDSWWGRRFTGGGRAEPADEDPLAGSEFGGMATGGVATGPDSGYNMELHGTEAVVPLPDGRSIPVTINDNIVTQQPSDNNNNYDSIVLSFENLIRELNSNNNSLTTAFEDLSYSNLIQDLKQFTTAPQLDNNTNQEVQGLTIPDFSTSLDSSRTLSEMLQVNKNMLSQMTTSTQKLEQMIRAMEQGNTISRNAAYARA